MKLEEIKLYMRVDTDADDALIIGLIAAAQQYIHETSGLVYDDTNNLHQLVCKLLVAHWYEHREIVGDNKEVPYTATRLLTHLAVCQHAGSTTTGTTGTEVLQASMQLIAIWNIGILEYWNTGIQEILEYRKYRNIGR